ncbi:citrate synthase [Yinghuangia seranimata]|uniref:citrate synthase n=1 Tax=Yinghuangia seranimata TaxID=408067 RepID=UPI00248D173D|nr:citrate synthase [Yinghuangia seranimata]MDI2130807.1 citrate synthase [Yinghuangia seranimata]
MSTTPGLAAAPHSGPRRDTTVEVPRGLAGVIVTDTEIGDVRGREGFYHYRQYSAVELAERRGFEDVWHLMLHGELPDRAARDRFVHEIAPLRRVPDAVRPLLAPVAEATRADGPLAGVKALLPLVGSAYGMRPLYDSTPRRRAQDALALAAVVPTLIAALHRLQHGEQPVEPRDDLGYAANYLYLVTGEVAAPERARAVEAYLISTIDHGFNASTFTGRVIASTGADLASCAAGALGALTGPLHGGAPSRALDTLDAIGSPDRARAWITDRVLAGDRIMGFGHPVYRTEDPRARMLRGIAYELGGDLVEFAAQVEREVVAVLADLKPGRELHTNVEFWAGVVMELCGLPRGMFTPTFAASRVVGWTTHALEQAADTKIIRPSARYVGPPPPQPVPAAG